MQTSNNTLDTIKNGRKKIKRNFLYFTILKFELHNFQNSFPFELLTSVRDT